MAVLAALLTILTIIRQPVEEKGQLLNPLPISADQILSIYNPPPSVLRVETAGPGNRVTSYKATLHELELEESGGQLVRASIRYKERSPLLTDQRAALALPVQLGVFVIRVGDVHSELPDVMRQLGMDDVWSSQPSEVLVNGVRIRRHVDNERLVVDAVAASSSAQ